MRATSRLYGVSINTVTKLLIDIGAACDLYQNETLQKLSASASSAMRFGASATPGKNLQRERRYEQA